MEKKKFAAIVLSAGSGSRMHSNIPKQYMDLNGYPVIYYSLRAFEESPVDEIIMVCGAHDEEFCRKEIVEKYGFSKIKAVVPGGSERYLSVYEGIRAADADYVLIHDGARPVIDADSIRRSMETVVTERACVLAVPVKDTIKVADSEGYTVSTPDRSSLWAVQTPQSFHRALLEEAYRLFFQAKQEQKELPAITDDAMLVEQMTGHKVKLIRGKYENLKITTPEDLLLAKAFLDFRKIVSQKSEIGLTLANNDGNI